MIIKKIICTIAFLSNLYMLADMQVSVHLSITKENNTKDIKVTQTVGDDGIFSYTSDDNFIITGTIKPIQKNNTNETAAEFCIINNEGQVIFQPFLICIFGEEAICKIATVYEEQEIEAIALAVTVSNI